MSRKIPIIQDNNLKTSSIGQITLDPNMIKKVIDGNVKLVPMFIQNSGNGEQELVAFSLKKDKCDCVYGDVPGFGKHCVKCGEGKK